VANAVRLSGEIYEVVPPLEHLKLGGAAGEQLGENEQDSCDARHGVGATAPIADPESVEPYC
jgi:hypothetical protein